MSSRFWGSDCKMCGCGGSSLACCLAGALLHSGSGGLGRRDQGSRFRAEGVSLRRKSACILVAGLGFHLHLHGHGAVHRVHLNAHPRAWQTPPATLPRAAVLRPRAARSAALRPEAVPQGGGFRRATQGALRWEAGSLATSPPPVFAPAEREVFIDNLLIGIHLIIGMILVDQPCALGF